jgi:hypothetical protein
VTAEKNAGEVAAEQPILWLGMSGFSPPQRAALESSLARPSGFPRWRVCAFGDADAWWVNGTNVRVMPGGNLKVAAGLPSERALNLDLSEVDRPVAFAAPLASADFEPRCSFDPTSGPGIQAVLLQFESWLRLVRGQFVLGKQIIERGGEQLRHGVYHVSHGGNLLAVLDFYEGKVALSPSAHPVDLWEAQWHKRPIGARDMPHTFVRFTPAELAWTYLRRTDRDMLPPRYRQTKIYYRGAPRVPVKWLHDSQLLLLRELVAQPGTVDAFRQRTGLSTSLVEHDLAFLYYAGAITTTRSKAAQASPAGHDSQPHSAGPELYSLLGENSHFANDRTAPASLEHNRPLLRRPSAET